MNIEPNVIEPSVVTSTTIALNAQVYCRNEPCGKVVSAIINPARKTLTHLIVRGTRQRPHTERVVSIRLLDLCLGSTIYLSCSVTAFNRLPEFEKEEEIPLNSLDSMMMVDEWFETDSPLWPLPRKTTYRNLPAQAQELQPRTAIQATNGRVGTLSQVIIASNDNHITHLIMQCGYLWKQRQVTIPIEQVHTLGVHSIRLKLNKREVTALPTPPLPQG